MSFKWVYEQISETVQNIVVLLLLLLLMLSLCILQYTCTRFVTANYHLTRVQASSFLDSPVHCNVGGKV